MSAMQIINGQTPEAEVTGSSNSSALSQPQLDILYQASSQTKAY
jgi:hypothetical protein